MGRAWTCEAEGEKSALGGVADMLRAGLIPYRRCDLNR
jgi:hypothetical protein